MNPTQGLHLAVFGCGLAVASVLDIRARRIPNWVTVPLFCAGITAAGLSGGVSAAGWALLGGLCGLALLIGPFAKGWTGAGDVKLLAAIGTWLGPLGALLCALASAAFGGLLSLAYALRLRGPGRADVWTNLRLVIFTRSLDSLPGDDAPRGPPYAPAMAVGALSTLWITGVGIAI